MQKSHRYAVLGLAAFVLVAAMGLWLKPAPDEACIVNPVPHPGYGGCLKSR